MKNFFCFIHLRKTAGTTFAYLLRRNFRTGYLHIAHNLFEGKLDPIYIRETLDRETHLRAVHSHRLTGDLPYGQSDYRVIGITFVRDPVDRLKSHYYYSRNLIERNDAHKCDTLEDFVSMIKSDPAVHERWINTQSKALELTLDEATKKIKEGQLHVFPTKRYDESLVVLNKLYPSDFSDVSYARKNVNKRRPNRKHQELIEQIREMTQEDQKLYDLSQSHLNEMISSKFEPGEMQAMLKRHQRNCKVRSVFLEPLTTICEKVTRGMRYVKLSYGTKTANL